MPAAKDNSRYRIERRAGRIIRTRYNGTEEITVGLRRLESHIADLDRIDQQQQQEKFAAAWDQVHACDRFELSQ